MKTVIGLLNVGILCLLLTGESFAEELVGGPYSIQPLSINGGGLTSTAGPYEVSASTAQPGGVGVITEGPYTLEDGFWAAVLAVIVTGGINYDIAPDTLDGFIDARDLLGWYTRIVDKIEEADLLFDFGNYWQGPFSPSQ